VRGLAPKQAVVITVTATNADGEAAGDPRTVTTRAAKPAPATDVRLQFNAKKPRVTWRASASSGGAVVRYTVTVRNRSGASVASAQNVAGTAWTGPRALGRGTYTATVVAVNEAGSATPATSPRVVLP
jgi:hypothetical protein